MGHWRQRSGGTEVRISFGVLSLLFLTLVGMGWLFAQEPAKEEGKVESILKANGLVEDPSQMVRIKLLSEIDEAQARWEANYETVKTPEDLATYQKVRKDYFWRQLGALWDKTPLNPKITGRLTKPDYRVEKVVFESLPHFYVTGTVFLPLEEKFAPPYPAVLIVCGHSNEGKAADYYQGIGILAAMNGLASMVMDPIDQGERFQHLGPDGKPFAASVSAHNLVGAGSILLGRNAATFEIWDMVRALDYLQSRPDVLPDRLGVAGNSGGGTQSSYLMALDERVTCAAPSCYLCNLFDTLPHVTNPQDAEQNIFGQVGFGMDHADYVIMRAPKPTLMSTRTGDFFNIDDAWKTFRFAKRIYSRLGMAEKVALIEIEGDHGYCPDILNAGVRWMLRWLAGRDELIVGPDPLPILTKEEIRSTSDGVMALPDARTTYDLNRDLNAELNETRRKELAEIDSASFAELVRRAAGIRPLTELPAPEVIEDKSGLGDKILRTEPGIYLPLRTEWDESDGDAYRLLVTSEGRRSGSVEAIFAGLSSSEGPAACVELRGWGETQGHGSDYYHHSYFGEEGTIYYLAYLLGKNYVAMRAEDLLVTARWLKETTGKRIELIADSPSAGIVALHAKAVEPDLFASVTLSSEPIPTWSSLVEAAPDKPIRLTDTIHGVLNYYDIDDLLRLTGVSMSE